MGTSEARWAGGFEPAALLAPRQAIVAFLGAVAPAPPGSERISIGDAAGRVLAEDVRAADDLPFHARSTMDGFAVACSRGTRPRRLTGDVLMGSASLARISESEAMRIPTGGMLPQGADAVIPLEDAAVRDGMVESEREPLRQEYVTPRGSDLASGEVALERGRKLAAAELGVLAALGAIEVTVHRRPRFAVLSTGDEIVEPSAQPGFGQVRDSNRFAIVAALQALGCDAFFAAAVKDDARALEAALRDAIEGCDGVVLSGGTSVGERDFVPPVVNRLGEPGVIVHGLRVKPGKPTMLAALGRKPVIGLPGNPTSALMMLEAVVRPIVAACTGDLSSRPPGLVAYAREPFVGREGWTWFAPVRLELVAGRLAASPLRLHSAHVSLLARAHGYAVLDEHRHRIEVGEPVRVEPLSGSGPPIGDGPA